MICGAGHAAGWCAAQAEESASGFWSTARAWLGEHSSLLAWLGIGSLLSLVLVAALLPGVVVRLDADHFATSRAELMERGGIYRGFVRVGKNLLGAVFLVAGFLMLFLPGQGVLTMLIGLLLLEFPGKRAIERRVVRRPAVLGMLNRLRARAGRPPFVVD